MKRALSYAALLMLAAAGGCSHGADLSRAATQENFGVQMAKQNLWREAMFRFQRTVELQPADAMAHNNLAVALEANGDFEKARQEYLAALSLDKSNQYIQKNYSRYVEFSSRNKKRQQKSATGTAAPGAIIPPSAGAGTATPPVPGIIPPSGGRVPAPPDVRPPSDRPPPAPAKPPGGGVG